MVCGITVYSDRSAFANGALRTSTGRVFSIIPKSASQTSPRVGTAFLLVKFGEGLGRQGSQIGICHVPIIQVKLGFRVAVGPVPIAFAGMSVPFDFDQTMVNSFAFNGTTHRLQCTASDGRKNGSGGRYDILIPPKCEIRNTNGVLLGLVGAALTDQPASWGEVSGGFGKVLVDLKSFSHYRTLVFHNHFGTHNLEFSFGRMAKGESAFVEGEIEVTPQP